MDEREHLMKQLEAQKYTDMLKSQVAGVSNLGAIGGALQHASPPEPPLRSRISLLENQISDLAKMFEVQVRELTDRIYKLETQING